MPRTTDPRKYPPEYWRMLDAAQLAPVVIPHASPAGLRAYIQAFLKAVETLGPDDPRTVRALNLQVTQRKGADPAVIVQRRSDSVYARAVAAALGSDASPEATAAADLARRFGGQR